MCPTAYWTSASECNTLILLRLNARMGFGLKETKKLAPLPTDGQSLIARQK